MDISDYVLVSRTYHDDERILMFRTYYDDTLSLSDIEKHAERDNLVLMPMQNLTSFPQSRAFRQQWKLSADNTRVIINWDFVRQDMYMRNVRRVRSAELRALDQKVLFAMEEDNLELKKRLVQRKQVLRDLPQDPELKDQWDAIVASSKDDAETYSRLSNLWPSSLDKKYLRDSVTNLLLWTWGR
tara:strand:- start:8480 stop:9034 length:555 start_codon:yes stop_codon:yes gene_type:complete